MARNRELMLRLEQADAGVRATRGQNDNLFAAARAELERLYAIEGDVELLLKPAELGRDSLAPNYTAALRLEAGRRLGIAVGAIKPKGE